MVFLLELCGGSELACSIFFTLFPEIYRSDCYRTDSWEKNVPTLVGTSVLAKEEVIVVVVAPPAASAGSTADSAPALAAFLASAISALAQVVAPALAIVVASLSRTAPPSYPLLGSATNLLYPHPLASASTLSSPPFLSGICTPLTPPYYRIRENILLIIQIALLKNCRHTCHPSLKILRSRLLG